METASPDRLDAEEPQFADQFLQDRNIKWILASGAAILLGSSLMLVSSQWSGYSALLKEVIFLAYTYGVFAVGHYGYKKLALRRTGTMLLALALLLAPAACAALPWLWEKESWNVAYVALLIAGGGVTMRIGASSLKHFLREPQPALTAAYVVLALAGAVVPVWEFAHSPWMALALWGVFAVGAIKANRRVFWLVEEHRQPRIVGFFPMALLGAQFLTLFVLCYAERTAIDWIGFGCVLTAAPLLVAADAVARVFQQRTGNLVRPLPWSILAPLGGGLLLVTAGVILAATKIAGGLPFALVPSAAVAAVLLGLVARRTERREFVYAAIGLTVVAYRFLPVFFLETTRYFVQATADAIYEQKLPWAFYGFTFLPLLTVFTFVGEWARRRGNRLFAEPLRVAAMSLSLAFLALSITHEKALFPAAATLAVVFAVQTVVYRNRLLAIPALAAVGIAAAGIPTFYNGVLATGSYHLSSYAWFTCEAITALLLTTVGQLVDRFFRRYPFSCFGQPLSPSVQAGLDSPCRQTGLLLTVGLSAMWLLDYFIGTAVLPGLSIAALLAVTAFLQAYVQRRFEISVAAIVYANLIGGIALAEHLPVDVEYGNALVAVLIAQWLGSYLLLLRPESRLGETFGPALRKTSLVMLTLAFVGVAVPLHAAQAATDMMFHHLDWQIVVPSVLLLAWAFDAARREKHEFFGYLALIGLFTFLSSAFRTLYPDDYGWLPTLWVAIAATLVPLEMFVRREPLAPSGLRVPLRNVVPSVLVLIAIGSWFGFTLPAIVAGMAAPVVLQASLVVRRHPLRGQVPAMLLNWRLLGVVAALACPQVEYLHQLRIADVAEFSLPVALAAAVSLVVWSLKQLRLQQHGTTRIDLELTRSQQESLRVVLVYLMLMSLWLASSSTAMLLMAAGVFVIVTALELYAACMNNDERRVWVAEVIASAAVGYFAWFGVIHFGRGFAMYLVLGTGLALWFIGQFARRHPDTAVLAEPFQMTGRWLPLVTVGLGVFRHVWHFEMNGASANWLGWNSLALLLAAAFYFHQGLLTREKNFTVLAAGILNVAVALLWRELHLSDPQFYLIPLGITVLGLVELLEREIPEDYRDPLRYLGALIILVSPMFHIVDGSWLHIFTLMVAAALVVLAGIGLRIRAMLYTGTAFLLADLVAMVVRGSIDHPELLWVAGLALGAAVLGIGAACELRRERIQQRVRAVSASLESWK